MEAQTYNTFTIKCLKWQNISYNMFIIFDKDDFIYVGFFFLIFVNTRPGSSFMYLQLYFY